jgi:CRISPR/Cas system-associated exonuclease Cas4 (RecB family)
MSREVEPPDGTHSASALQDYDLCPRKWAWRKLDGFKAPDNPAAEFGKEVHSQIESWLRDGKPFDLTTEAGECALASLHYLPKPGTPGMHVETPFLLNGWDHKFFGYKDVELPGPVVWDHKTSKDPAKWGYTVETLPDNIQAALYAAHAMVKAGTDHCDLVWNYIRTKRPYRGTPIRVRVIRERIEPTLIKIRRLANEMSAIRDSGLKALDLPFNASACEGFGGCPYRALCNLTPSDRVRAIMSHQTPEQAKEELYAKLRAKMNGGAGSDINPPVPPVAAPQLSPDGNYQLVNGAWIPYAAPPPPPPPPVNAAPPPPPPPPVNAAPPPPPPPPVNAAPPPPVTTPQLSPDGNYQLVNGTWIPYAAPPSAPESTPATGRGRGRPSGSRNKKRTDAGAATPETPAGHSTARSMLINALRTISEGFAALAESIDLGALDPDDSE